MEPSPCPRSASSVLSQPNNLQILQSNSHRPIHSQHRHAMTVHFKKLAFSVKNKAFQTLQHFFAVWARLELLDLDIFPAPRFGAAVEQEILRSLCMHYIPVPPRAAANKQTFLLVKEREVKKKYTAQSSPADVACESNPAFSADKENSMYLQCWCNVTVWRSWISKDLGV